MLVGVSVVVGRGVGLTVITLAPWQPYLSVEVAVNVFAMVDLISIVSLLPVLSIKAMILLPVCVQV